ncbi:MAG: cyclic nucleotide-binding domain-containing protein [Deltaproteobacteria bacterium]|nr:cyclic nucleotide-binding domain-containing protein [Deltaproteobacteria bacterium]
MGTDHDGASTPESEAAEEADWALATAATLQAKGDLDGARTWFRRAVEHLMDAGLDDRALVVAKQAAALSEPPPPVPTPPPAVPAPPPDPAPVFQPPAAIPSTTPTIQPPPAPAAAPPVIAPAAPTLQGPALTQPVLHLNVAYDPARSVATEAAAALLTALPLFADLPAERVRSLARESVIVPLRVAHDLPLSPQGEAAPLWVIVEGQVHLTVAGIPVGGTLGPGDFVGELSAYYESACLFRAEVTAEGRALCVAPTVLQSLAGQYEGLRTALEESAWERAFEALGHASALLAAIEPAMRAGLYARFEPVQFAAGDSLLTEGEPAAWVWLIAAGSVERYGGALGAKVQRAGAGSAVGVASAWEANPSGVSVRARRTTLAARVSAAAFREMVAEAPGLKGARSRADVW